MKAVKFPRFFHFYSFIALMGLIEATWGRWSISGVAEGVIYAVVIPVIVVSMILLLSLVYEKLKTGNISLAVKKEGDKSMLFLVGLLFIGIIFAYIPALLGIFIKPIVGWFLLPLTLLVLYRLDKIVESD